MTWSFRQPRVGTLCRACTGRVLHGPPVVHLRTYVCMYVCAQLVDHAAHAITIPFKPFAE